MISIVSLFLALSFSPAPAAPAPACEVHTDTVSGYSRTVCDGAVVRTCDASGTCHGPAASY